MKILGIYALLVVFIFGMKWIYKKIYNPQWDENKRSRINTITLLAPAIALFLYALFQICISKDILVPSNQIDPPAHALSIDVNNYLWKDYIIPLFSAILTGLFTFLGVMMTIRSSEKNIIENYQNQMEIVKRQTEEKIKYKKWEQAYIQGADIYAYFYKLQDECIAFTGSDFSPLIESCAKLRLLIEQSIALSKSQYNKALEIYNILHGLILSNPKDARNSQVLVALAEYRAEYIR